MNPHKSNFFFFITYNSPQKQVEIKVVQIIVVVGIRIIMQNVLLIWPRPTCK